MSVLFSGVVLMGWGILFSKTVLKDQTSRVSTPEFIFLGLFAAAVLGTFLNFFSPISEWVAVPFCGFGVVLFFIHLKTIEASLGKSKILSVSGAFLLVIACTVAANRGLMVHDTGLYHIQAMRWLRESTVPIGVAHLHGRLGFNSVRFIIGSLFWLPRMELGMVFGGNAVIDMAFLWAFVLFSLRSFDDPKKQISNLSVVNVYASCVSFFLLFSKAVQTFYFDTINSVGSDFSVTLFTLYAFYLALRLIELRINNGEKGKDLSLLLIVSVFSVSLKISCICVLLLPLYFVASILISEKKWPLGTRRSFVACGLFCVLWLLRGVLTSGCLIYPAAATCSGTLPWAVSQGQALSEQNWIASWARNSNLSPEIVLGSWAWFPEWLDGFLGNSFIRQTLAMAASGVALLLWFRRRNPISAPYWVLISVAGFGVLFWFSQAPDLRFGLGFILAFSMLLLALGLNAVKAPRFWLRTSNLFLGLLFGVFCFRCIYLARGIRTHEFLEEWPHIPQVTDVKNENWQGIRILSPVQGEDQCWNLPLPCTPYFDPSLTLSKAGIWRVFTKKEK